MTEPDITRGDADTTRGDLERGDSIPSDRVSGGAIPGDGQHNRRRPLDELETTILARQGAPDEQGVDKSYTAKLLAGGIEKIGGKIIEEAAELVEAAGEPAEAGRQHTIYEAGDLLYHTLVLLAARGVRLSEVEAELARRSGVSGLDEKASRGERGAGSVERGENA